MVALFPLLWVFGVCAILYGSTLLYWAWHSPEDADAAKQWIAAGLGAIYFATLIMSQI